MLDIETGTPERDRAFDCHVIPKASWPEESRPRAHERKAVEVEMLEHIEFGHAKRALEQKCRRCIEDFEVARVKDNPGWIAVAPLDPDLALIAECGHRVMPSSVRLGFPLRASPKRSALASRRRVRGNEREILESKRGCISAVPCAARHRVGSLRR